jgi:hypothetical protein
VGAEASVPRTVVPDVDAGDDARRGLLVGEGSVGQASTSSDDSKMMLDMRCGLTWDPPVPRPMAPAIWNLDARFKPSSDGTRVRSSAGPHVLRCVVDDPAGKKIRGDAGRVRSCLGRTAIKWTFPTKHRQRSGSKDGTTPKVGGREVYAYACA